MKKTLILSTILGISLSAWAFSGGGSGHAAKWYERRQGVDSVGVHMNGNSQVNIDFNGNELELNNCSPACTSEQECVDELCITKAFAGDNSCAKNSDCNGKIVGETTCADGVCYCNVSADTKDTSQQTACFSGFAGTCALISEGTAPTGTTYKVSSAPMTWWSAVNFCKALNRTLVSLADVGCEGDGETPVFSDSLKNSGYPSAFWSTNGSISKKITTGNNTCAVFRVYVNAWRVDEATRWSTSNIYALCRQP